MKKTTFDKAPADLPKISKGGRKVLMVGGPDAGRVRIVPEGIEMLAGDEDWMYKIHTMRFSDGQPVYFAFAANEHPGKMFVQMWREYSPAIMIKGDVEYQTYQAIRRANADQPTST